jgi:hypothetical protein
MVSFLKQISFELHIEGNADLTHRRVKYILRDNGMSNGIEYKCIKTGGYIMNVKQNKEDVSYQHKVELKL